MIYVNKKLKYMFDLMPVWCSPTGFSPEDRLFRMDQFILERCDEEAARYISQEDWEIIHKDGNIYNLCSDNLELVVFKDDKFFKDNKEMEKQMLSLKRKAEENAVFARDMELENAVYKNKVKRLENQVLYEQNRVSDLNKELNEKEREIRRLMDIINKRR